jgi:hypothetical protein
MTTFTINQSRSFEVPQRPTLAVHLPLSLWNAVLVGIVAVLGIWYLVQVNVTMSKNYQIRDAQNQVAAAETVARSNQIKLTELETVSNLTAQATALGMVPVGSVEYVTRPSSGVAFR